MVEVFKTNVQTKKQSIIMLSILREMITAYKINFDLSDCDKILRIEAEQINIDEIIKIFFHSNFKCEVLQ